MNFTKFLKESLKKLKNDNLYRERKILSNGIIDFSSNDYLGLRKELKTKLSLCENIENIDLGSGGSALISGYSEIQKRLEEEIAKFKEGGRCLVVGSGYLANLGLLQAIATKDDIIFSDELNHASLIDGIRLSKAKKYIYKHLDLNDLEIKLKKAPKSRFKFIVSDGVFSMEGDILPYKDIKFLADKYNCILIIDDAHSTGILGDGKGTIFHFKEKPDDNVIQVGTLSKAVGSYGAFIVGTKELIDYLVNKMRSAIFSTALSPIQNYISLINLRILIQEAFRREKVLKTAYYVYNELTKLGYKMNYYGTPILTLILGEVKKALEFRDRLLKNGIFIQAIRPPTVPKGTARLRITLSYNHSDRDIEKLINAFKLP